MKKILAWALLLSLLFPLLFSHLLLAKPPCKDSQENTWKNNIPPRRQWETNFGYCGEMSFISAGLYYGQYVSQYTARAVASPGIPQNLGKSQLLLGVNDQQAAARMHLTAIAWNARKKNTRHFLVWVREHVIKGYPVIIGIFDNQTIFAGKHKPLAGSREYDHIVPVFGIDSHFPLHEKKYCKNDVIYFSDIGLWGHQRHRPYLFSYPFGRFQANRKQANAEDGDIYSLPDQGINFGIAITGVMDLNGDTLPVRVDTNLNYEKPSIQEGSSIQPPPMPLILTITVSQLEPGVLYNLYRYDDLDLVPDSNFNAHAANASQNWQIQIQSGSTFVLTEEILSNEIAVYRAVKATAP